MSLAINEPSGHPDYDRLPVAIKMLYTPEQWLWLSDDQKGRLVQTECEPEISQ